MIRAVAITKAVRRGSWLQVVVEASDGGTYRVRCEMTGEDVKASVVDWLSSNLAVLLDVPVVRPTVIAVSRVDLQAACIDAAIARVIDGAAGLRLALPCHEDAQELRRGGDLPAGSAASDAIFLFDLLVGNSERIHDKSSIVRLKSRSLCCDFACSQVMRTAIDGRDSSLFQAAVYRRHPCYREGVSAHGLRLAAQAVPDASLAAIAETVPEIWRKRVFGELGEPAGKKRLFRALQIVRDRVFRLDAMIAAIERSHADPEGRRVSKVLARSSTFLCLAGRIAPSPQLLAVSLPGS